MQLELLQIDSNLMFLNYLLGALAICVILYHTIRFAVKNATIEAHEFKRNKVESNYVIISNSVQMELKKKYDLGEITLEELNKRWNIAK